jgi:DNA-binding MarR family transcriptional regulator
VSEGVARFCSTAGLTPLIESGAVVRKTYRFPAMTAGQWGMAAAGNRTDTALEDLQELARLLIGLAMRVAVSDESGLSLTQLRTLDALELFGTMKVRELADRVGIHASTMSRTCAHLQKSGFVSQEVNPESGREVLIQLTTKGRRVMRRVASRRTAILGEILDQLPKSDRAKAAVVLRALVGAATVTHAEQLAADE